MNERLFFTVCLILIGNTLLCNSFIHLSNGSIFEHPKTVKELAKELGGRNGIGWTLYCFDHYVKEKDKESQIIIKEIGRVCINPLDVTMITEETSSKYYFQTNVELYKLYALVAIGCLLLLKSNQEVTVKK